ncbi:ABC transporter substrate-binding protein [Kiloniella laminariae]|uniref:ABC transporter substrate-binding protein n=1 Tax=Kiloniella laminariae TaxID=454162 RepID=A0ABT4LKK4_9PROT|nr:ABC transporter substrate-binding protein [Kiloniella laminariae]MCZ4281616.1 ABC transporter substrate-binding protein [Kiloniella laminariae]
MKYISLATIAAATFGCVSLAYASGFPVTVESCGRQITFDQAPSRAVSHDMNISEIMFSLGLQEKMVGVTGISGWYKSTAEFDKQRGDLPELAPKNPNLETLLGVDPDFFFAGWYYGMNPGGDITPETLAEYDIPVYELTESCIHIDKSRPRASLDVLYQDTLSIGKIFGVEEKAQALVKQYKTDVDSITRNLSSVAPVTVFLFDSGEEKPFTAGKFGMPTALIEAAGGKNIMDDVDTSWGSVGWESIVERNPEFIILVGYADNSWEKSRDFLKSFPPLKDVKAITNDRFLVLNYTEITPGPNNIPAIRKLAKALHPELIN